MSQSSQSSSSAAGALDAAFWEALEAGRLVMPCCSGCGTWHWPVVSRCGACGSFDIGWKPVPFEGIVYSWIRTHVALPGTEAMNLPFVTLLVELPAAGGKRIMGLFEGDEAQLKIGLPIKGRVDHVDVAGRKVACTRWSAA